MIQFRSERNFWALLILSWVAALFFGVATGTAIYRPVPADGPAPVGNVQAAGAAVSQHVGNAGSFITVWRVDYDGQAYLVVSSQHGVAITRHAPAEGGDE